MSVYAVIMGKGGVGKTTFAAEIVAYLASQGRRVLAIDLDQQAAFTARLDAQVKPGGPDAADVILGESTVNEAAVPSRIMENVSIIPGTFAMGDIDADINITALRDMLADSAFDDVVIDTMPVLMNSTTAAGAAADKIVIPVSGYHEALSQAQFVKTWVEARIMADVNPKARIVAIVPMMFGTTRRFQEAMDTLRDTFGPDLVTEAIPSRTIATDSFAARKPVSQYRPNTSISFSLRAAAARATK